MSIRRIVVPLRPGSDGDASHVPAPGSRTQVDPPMLYLEKIGQKWMEARGEAVPGVQYALQRLPAGYTMWQRPRPSNPKHVDKYLYGHPQGRNFDSPNRFYPHFEFLMQNGGSSMGCPCTVCAGRGGVLPKSSKASSTSSKKPTSSANSSQPSTPKGSSVVTLQPRSLHISRNRSSSASSSASASGVAHQPKVHTNQSVHEPAHRPGNLPVDGSIARMPSTLPAAIGQGRGRHKFVRAGGDSSSVDEEGAIDVYRHLIDKLGRHQTVDEAIHEHLSPDWQAEQKILPELLRMLQDQEQWIPRAGEVVLFIRNVPPGTDVVRNESSGEYAIIDEKTQEYRGSPLWEAGVVGETPAEPTSIVDLYEDSDKNVIYAGIRVEPLPHPNSTDKSFSKQYKYISLRQARPFVLWKELLEQIPQPEWHPTVKNALTAISTFSLVGRHRFRGTWPKADIYCHGLFIGHEMIAVGDTVRLLPSLNKSQTQCVEVLVIKSIRLKLSNLDQASNNDYDDGRPYNTEVWVYGSCYTSDAARMNKEYLSEDNTNPPKAADAYGEWFPLHPTSKELAVPHTRILSRLYEREAMAFWLGTKPRDLPNLDSGREAMVTARAFSRKHDQRITQTWYWGDNRADSLGLQTINGLEIAKFDQERDIRDMRKMLKLIESMENSKKSATAKSTATLPSDNRNLRCFLAPGTEIEAYDTIPARGASTSDSAPSSSTGESSVFGKKRPHIIDVSDDEDEEIREYTKVVEDDHIISNKRARVTVVIK